MKDLKKQRMAELEQFLRDHNAANFVEGVVTRDDTDFVLMSLSAFYQEPEVLYAALEYASYWGRTVQIIPLIDEHMAL